MEIDITKAIIFGVVTLATFSLGFIVGKAYVKRKMRLRMWQIKSHENYKLVMGILCPEAQDGEDKADYLPPDSEFKWFDKDGRPVAKKPEEPGIDIEEATKDVKELLVIDPENLKSKMLSFAKKHNLKPRNNIGYLINEFEKEYNLDTSFDKNGELVITKRKPKEDDDTKTGEMVRVTKGHPNDAQGGHEHIWA